MKKAVFLIALTLIACCNLKKEDEKKSTPVEKSEYIKREVIYGLGPNDEKPSTIQVLEDIIKKSGDIDFSNERRSIIVAMHDIQNDWSSRVLDGINETLLEYGLRISLATDGEFSIDKQLSDYKQILEMKPEILITLTVDSKAMQPILKKIEHKGTKIIFIDNLPEGFIPGKNCIGWAVGDCYTMGKAGMEELVTKVGRDKYFALLNWKNSMFTVDMRSKGARDYLKENNLKFEEFIFDGFHEIEKIVLDRIGLDNKLNGFWAVWDTPALEVLSALEKNNYDAKIVTADLSKEIAMKIAEKDSKIISTIADDPYSIGKTEALLAIATLKKIEVPGYFVVPVIRVKRDNLKEAWRTIYKKELPLDINQKLRIINEK